MLSAVVRSEKCVCVHLRCNRQQLSRFLCFKKYAICDSSNCDDNSPNKKIVILIPSHAPQDLFVCHPIPSDCSTELSNPHNPIHGKNHVQALSFDSDIPNLKQLQQTNTHPWRCPSRCWSLAVATDQTETRRANYFKHTKECWKSSAAAINLRIVLKIPP